jgi:hypothetical protein
MAKNKKTAKRKKKTGKRKATRKSRKRGYKGSALHKYNMKRSKQARKGKRKSRKAKSKAYAAKRGASSILGYKEHARHAAEKKAVREKLTAQGKPKAVVDKIMNRLYRMRGPKKTKSKGWASAYAAQQAAERAEAYARQNYARHVSYN